MADIQVRPFVESGDSSWWQSAPLAASGPSAPKSQFADAISGIESGGNYQAVGPATRTGDRALGKYQVMGANVRPWTKEVLGRELTPTEFINSPEAQDAVFNAKFGQYAQKYGPEGAAKAWFAGEGGMNDPNRRDVLGTSVASYADKFMNALGPNVANAAPAPQQPVADNNWWQSAPLANEAPPQPQPKQPPEAAPGPTVGTGESFMRGALQGLTFNFLDELTALSKAGGASNGQMGIDHLLVGLYKKLSGDPDFAKKFEEALAGERATNKAAEQQHPVANTVGQVAGSMTLPVGPIANAATLPARMGRGLLLGAGMGGAYGAGAGEGIDDRVSGAAGGALIGGAVGAVAPAAIEGVIRGGRAVGTGLSNTVRGIRNPEDEAARRVAVALQRDARADPGAVSRLTPQEFAASAQSGGPGAVIDMGGDTTRALARSAANTSPEGRTALNNVIDNRFEGQAGRVTDWLRRTFHYPDAGAQQEALKKAAQSVNKTAYARAYEQGDKEIWTPELERLTAAPYVQSALGSAISKWKNYAVRDGYGAANPPFRIENGVLIRSGGGGMRAYPNLQLWDYAARELQDAARAAPIGSQTATLFNDLARLLKTELDKLVPSYKVAREGAAGFFKAENALEAGENFVTQNFANGEARRALAKMSPLEKQLFQDGFVSRFIEDLNRTGDRRSVLNKIAESPAAREKLNIALGPQKAAELEAGLRVEGIMDLARSAVQGNSTTARQLAELGLAGGAYGLGTGGDILNPNTSALMNAALVYGAMRGRARINENVSRRVAELLASNDPSRLIRGIRVLASNQQLFNSLRAFDASFARVGASQGPAPAVQLPAISRADSEQDPVPRPPGQ